MIGWWTQDVASLGPRSLYGPCGPTPDDAAWVEALATAHEPDAGVVAADKSATVPVRDGPVSAVAPVWEAVPAAAGGTASAGASNGDGDVNEGDDVENPLQALQFFVKDLGVFDQAVKKAHTTPTGH